MQPIFALVIPLGDSSGLVPSHPIAGAPPGVWPSPPVYPGHGLPPQPGHPDQGLPPQAGHPSHPIELPPRPPGTPAHPVYNPGAPTQPIHIPGTPTTPIFIPPTPTHPIALPPGHVYPPLPPSVTGKALCLVMVVGVGYRWVVLDASQPK